MGKSKLEDLLQYGKLPIDPGCSTSHLMAYFTLEETARKVLEDFYPNERFSGFECEERPSYSIVVISGFTKSKEKRIYAKVPWDCSLREALAVELNNLLTSHHLPYRLYGGVVATEEVKGEQLRYLDFESFTDDEAYSQHFGMLEEFSRVIGLDDRRSENIIRTESGELRNIDFGQSFMHNSSKGMGELMLFEKEAMPKNIQGYDRGRRIGREIIRKNLTSNLKRVCEILRSIDEKAYERLNIKPKMSSRKSIYHPRDVLVKYAASNGWEDIAKRLE